MSCFRFAGRCVHYMSEAQLFGSDAARPSRRDKYHMKQQVKRREPSQGRAQKTMLLIFEAASRLLEQEGLENFNTNRLAEISGFSVGTIYQYFADKRAILLALAQHEQERAMA